MNKVILQHVPAAELPEKLRGAIPESALVTVTVQEEASTPGTSLKDVKRLLDEARRYTPSEPVSGEEAVARIRALRDEWDR